MDEDERGNCVCTVEPPDYKGRYSKTYPEYCCSFYESDKDNNFETKDEYYVR